MKKITSIFIIIFMLGITCFQPSVYSMASDVKQVSAETESVDKDLEAEAGEEEIKDEQVTPDGQETADGQATADAQETTEGGTEQTEGENGDENGGSEEPVPEIEPAVSYETHVQSIGWQSAKADGQTAGTVGQSLRVEGLKVSLKNVEEGKGQIEYRTHVQSYGWQDFVKNGELSGTTGKKKRIEAVKIRLTGELAEHYDIYYRTHVQTYGWLDWACNGAGSGTMGYSKRVEAIEIRLIKKGEAPPENTKKSYIYPKTAYQAHSQTVGWQKESYDNAIAGTVGKSKRLEALKIKMPDQEYEGDIQYRVYLQTYGWQSWKKNGELAGTTGQQKRIEAVEIKLTGEMAEHYDVCYSIHLAKIGWRNYAMNGETTGSIDLSKKIEAIKISIVKKEDAHPDTSGVKFINGYSRGDFYYTAGIQDEGQSSPVQQGDTVGTTGKSKRLENLTLYLNQEKDHIPSGQIQYSTHLSKVGWQGWSAQGEMNGSADGTYGIEAVKILLSGEISRYYDIYYRAHIQKYGWLGWAKNGQAAGSTGIGYRVEALQIKLVSKDALAPGANKNYYTNKKYRRYQNPGQYYQIRNNITLSGGGYILSYGYEGVKVMKVIQKLGLGSGIGMGGAFYGNKVKNAVANFQRRNGLSATGNVDLITWLRLGFNQLQWEQWGAYVSPMKVNENSSRSDHIEAMINTAYSYLGTAYVIGASGPPGTGIDCSGLVMQGLYSAGLDISPINPVRHAKPGYEYESRNMWASSKFKHVPYSQRQRGDLIFYQSASGVVIHVAIYLGNDMVIESWPDEVVVWPVRNGSRSNIKGVIRPFV